MTEPTTYYFRIFALLLAAGVGFPIPEEIPVVWGGVLVATDALRWWIMLPVCITGVVISDGLLYAIGRIWGRRLLELPWIKTRLLPPKRRRHIEDNFHKYGVKILLFARFLPAIRSPIFITAGMMRVTFARFLLADSIYAIPGVSLLFFLGFWFTDQFNEAVKRAESYRPLAVVVVIVAVGSYMLYHFLHQPVAMGDPEELPVIGQPMAAKLMSAAADAPPDSKPKSADVQTSASQLDKIGSARQQRRA